MCSILLRFYHPEQQTDWLITTAIENRYKDTVFCGDREEKKENRKQVEKTKNRQCLQRVQKEKEKKEIRGKLSSGMGQV